MGFLDEQILRSPTLPEKQRHGEAAGANAGVEEGKTLNPSLIDVYVNVNFEHLPCAGPSPAALKQTFSKMWLLL
jgi:hypothetical protein